MKKFITFILISVCFYGTAQDNPVSIARARKGNVESIYFKNNTNVTYEATIKLRNVSGYKTKSGDYSKVIKPKDSVLVIRLVPLNGKTPSLSMSYNYKPKMTKEEVTNTRNELVKYAYKKGDDLSQGIVLFERSNCSRCHIAISYLLENNIPFKWVELPTNEQIRNKNLTPELKENQILYDLINAQNGYVSYETMTPSFIVNGTYSPKQDNMMEYLKALN